MLGLALESGRSVTTALPASTLARPAALRPCQLPPMTRTLLLAAFALPTLAPAQTSANPAVDTAEPIAGPVRYAGTYNVTTRTWSRSQRALARTPGSAQAIYSNTASSGYYTPVVGPTGGAAYGSVVDDGAIPSTSDPRPFPIPPGRDASTITTVQIGYCDFETTPGVSGWQLDFYNRYDPCTYPPEPAQLAGTVTLSGAPTNGCWVVDITGVQFDLLHDGDGVHDGVPALDHFGIEWRYTGTGTEGAGLQITGDPLNTDPGWVPGNQPLAGSNTYFGEVSGCPGTGTGFDNFDFYWVEDSLPTGGLPAGSDCFFFGGYANLGSPCGGPIGTPYGGFWVELSSDGAAGPAVISSPGCIGLPNDTGAPGEIELLGCADPAQNNVVLLAHGLPQNQFGIFTTGLTPIAPGIILSGNGTVCIDPNGSGGLGRFDGAVQVKNTGTLGEMSLDTQAGEWNVSSIPTSTGTYAAATGISSYFQAWHREASGAGYNFSGSAVVIWQ